MGRLVINGDEIYELDEECLKEKRMHEERERRHRHPEERKRTDSYAECFTLHEDSSR